MPVFSGDYNSFHAVYQDKHIQYQFLATDSTTANILLPSTAEHRLYIQRIKVSITTYGNKTLGFQDSAGFPIGLMGIPAAVGTGPGNETYEIDFGPHGVQLGLGASLQLVFAAAGNAGIVIVDAYERKLISVTP